MQRLLSAVVGVAALTTVAHAAPPDFHEVPAALRTAPDGTPLTEAQRQALSDRKTLSALVQDAGPEPWPGVVVAIVDGTPREILAVLRDYAHFPEFMPYVARAAVLSHEGNHWVVEYTIKGPLGIGDRQYQMDVYDEQQTLDGVSFLVGRFAFNGKGNIKSTQGAWKLVPIWDGKATFVRYETRTDPGGGFTPWLKRKIAGSSLPKVIEAVRKRLAAGKAR